MRDELISRRRVLVGGTLVGGAALSGAGFVGGVAFGRAVPAVPERRAPRELREPVSAERAWAALSAGNRRWMVGRARHPHQDPSRRRYVATSQHPYAVVLSCIDSRVPPEVVFDVGVGDLLVVRTAAHTLDPLVLGAVEYGPEELGVPLVVVLGHQRCGAVTAAAHAIRDRVTLPGDLQRIVEALRGVYTPDIERMITAHTRDTVARLRPLLPHVVGARYDLDSGGVTRLV
ncbi:carbonic anhydrase [Nonomuraea dietziae]|uniref:Carbonic anhydrase n=1 Tax=Nonomuraea dietziae TaxID=65515 RepID=A0A7W5VH36_9ACTN|nr:carbonic anhydrase [Nonomuraea dietziae]MBB3733535.1 carbonic anhydrase [Nonomuraea dietziae]